MVFDCKAVTRRLLAWSVSAGAEGFITDDFLLSDTDTEKRVGEAYYRADQQWMVYQAEVADENPFYQIYLKNLKTGNIQRVSPGFGKTTCSWIHPEHDKVLFSSTHDDPNAKTKMTDELESRKSGNANHMPGITTNFTIFMKRTCKATTSRT